MASVGVSKEAEYRDGDGSAKILELGGRSYRKIKMAFAGRSRESRLFSLSPVVQMNSFTRIGLPILLVAVGVFLITVVSRYSSEEDKSGLNSTTNSQAGLKQSKEPPLKFFTTLAALNSPQSSPKHLKFWNPEAETNEAGYFNFWVSNKNAQPVTLHAIHANCQCASVELANPKAEDVASYTALSALFNSPLFGTPMPVNELAVHSVFASKLDWNLFYSKDKDVPTEIPAAEGSLPRLSIIRMNWAGRDSQGTRVVSTDLAYRLPETSEVSTRLEANLMVVPSFGFLGRNGSSWNPLLEIQLGELRENSQVKHEFYVVSTSRLVLDLNATLDGAPTPCIQISPPIRATDEEIRSLLSYKIKDSNGERPFMNRVGSLYKYVVDVRERAPSDTGEIKQLDLGIVDRRVRVENGGEHRSLMIRGRTMGDIRVLSGAETGKIEMGNGFSSENDIQKVITLIAERPGLDISLLSKEVVPNFLKVKLEPQKEIDGRKNWRLTVMIPKGSLYGSLPINSVIVLQTNDPSPRKIRLPVIGSSYDASANKP